MDQKMVEEHLARAETHVKEGETHIARQGELVAKLEQDGHDSVEARASLILFQEMQAMHIADRDRLRKELDRITGGGEALHVSSQTVG
jgi:hypothetical protein